MTSGSIPVGATSLRLWSGAALCLLPMGLVWAATPGFSAPGTTLYGSCDGDFCTPDIYVPGYFTKGTTQLVAQSPVAVFLLLSALVFAYAGSRRRTPATLRATRAAAGLLALVAVLAAANKVALVLLCVLGALALVGPLVVRRSVLAPVPDAG